MLAERIAASQLAEMSAQRASLSDRLRPGDLPRLSGVLAVGGSQDPIAVEVGFELGPEALPVVHVQAAGRLDLVCQRCLSPVSWPVEVDVSLTAVASDAQAAELADPFDSILLEDGDLALRDAVEDEVLAVLPLAPLHADPADCRALERAGGQDRPVPRVNRPFADLAEQMRRHAGSKDNDQDSGE